MKVKIAILVLVFSLLCISVFSQNSYNIVDFGAKEGGATVNTASIQRAIDTCHE